TWSSNRWSSHRSAWPSNRPRWLTCRSHRCSGRGRGATSIWPTSTCAPARPQWLQHCPHSVPSPPRPERWIPDYLAESIGQRPGCRDFTAVPSRSELSSRQDSPPASPSVLEPVSAGTPPRYPADPLGDRCVGNLRLGAGRCIGHVTRTSSMRTGRCSIRDFAQASAILSASNPSATVHGDGRFPATTSMNVLHYTRQGG